MNTILKQNKKNIPVIFLMGPTASNKTKLSLLLHQKLPIEIINVDSGLIYRGMNIGTNKPSSYELKTIPHHLIDICYPNEYYSVSKFRKNAIDKINKIIQKKNIPILVGGSMFYFKILLNGLSPLPSSNIYLRKYLIYQNKIFGSNSLHNKLSTIDPLYAQKIHPNDSQRILRALEIFYLSGKKISELYNIPSECLPYTIYQFAIAPNNKFLLHKKIEFRFYQMLEQGFEKEVLTLMEKKCLDYTMPSMKCIGYKQIWFYLLGKINYHNMILQSITETKKLAKKQYTWLRKWENLYWLDSDSLLTSIKTIISKIKY